MKRLYLLVFSLILLIIVLVQFSSNLNCKKEFYSGITAPSQPEQNNNNYSDSFIFKDNYTITPLADFYIKAKILSKKNYNTLFGDSMSGLSPLDLALGWDKMSDDNNLKDIKISQSGRWYRWRTKKPPISIDEIKNNSANMHIIPLNDKILSILNSACVGSTIELEGSLVKATDKRGLEWNSSLTRTDSGAGACEIIFVHHAKIIN